MVHTANCLDALVNLAGWKASNPSRRRMLSFAVLAHDFGKPPTTEHAERRGKLRWVSPGHEAAGGPLSDSFLRRIGAPLELDPPVRALVVHHLAHHHGREGEFSDTQVRRLARKYRRKLVHKIGGLAPERLSELELAVAFVLGLPY